MAQGTSTMTQLEPFPTIRPKPVEQALVTIQKFIHSEVMGSGVLLLFSLVALLWANSPWSESYFELWETQLTLTLGSAPLALSLHQWVNDGLMMFFFLLVGLEIKREMLVGELSSARQAFLPIAAAFGGMVAPALIFTLFNAGTETAHGWGIPMATDIAFALGLLAMLGSRVPLGLKVFLTALAVADDLGSILVIALFYSHSFNPMGLVLAGGFWLIIFALSRVRIFNGLLYFLLLGGVWLGFMLSGVHATIAGVAVAMIIPARPLIHPRRFIVTSTAQLDTLKTAEISRRSVLRDRSQKEAVTTLKDVTNNLNPPLLQLESGLHPWVTFLVLPLFALANAGVRVVGAGDLGHIVFNPVTLGVAFGLILGKQIGVTVVTWLVLKLGWAELPRGLTMKHIYAVSWLAGIGFTVALFVAELSFTAHEYADQAKIGILGASILAGIVGLVLVRWATGDRTSDESESHTTHSVAVHPTHTA